MSPFWLPKNWFSYANLRLAHLIFYCGSILATVGCNRSTSELQKFLYHYVGLDTQEGTYLFVQIGQRKTSPGLFVGNTNRVAHKTILWLGGDGDVVLSNIPISSEVTFLPTLAASFKDSGSVYLTNCRVGGEEDQIRVYVVQKALCNITLEGPIQDRDVLSKLDGATMETLVPKCRELSRRAGAVLISSQEAMEQNGWIAIGVSGWEMQAFVPLTRIDLRNKNLGRQIRISTVDIPTIEEVRNDKATDVS